MLSRNRCGAYSARRVCFQQLFVSADDCSALSCKITRCIGVGTAPDVVRRASRRVLIMHGARTPRQCAPLSLFVCASVRATCSISDRDSIFHISRTSCDRRLTAGYCSAALQWPVAVVRVTRDSLQNSFSSRRRRRMRPPSSSLIEQEDSTRRRIQPIMLGRGKTPMSLCFFSLCCFYCAVA